MHQMERIYANYAKERGVTSSELNLCYELHTKEQCTPLSIADAWSMPKQTVNSILRQLEKRGYIATEPHPDDARRKIISLTAEGRAYTETLIAPLIAAELRTLSAIEEADIDAVIRIESQYNAELERQLRHASN